MKKNKFDKVWRQKSLETLENNKWPDEKEYVSGLIKRCHEYRKIPVGQLNTGQLRTLIGQQIGLKYLIPVAIDLLENDILVEGDFYPGDLLEAVLKADLKFWNQNKNHRAQILELVEKNIDKIEEEDLNLDNWDALKNID